jgi:hypothetical protein
MDGREPRGHQATRSGGEYAATVTKTEVMPRYLGIKSRISCVQCLRMQERKGRHRKLSPCFVHVERAVGWASSSACAACMKTIQSADGQKTAA